MKLAHYKPPFIPASQFKILPHNSGLGGNREAKPSPAYEETIGRNLGIIGEEAAASAGPPKPAAKASAQPGGEVKIEFSKSGFDGVVIESRRGNETGWSRLGTDNFSPYLDTRPPLEAGRPEVRDYRLRFLDRDDPVGDWSDIISLSTTP